MKNHRRPRDSAFNDLAIQKKLRRCCLKVDTLRPASLKKKKKLNKETPAQVFFLRILQNFSNHLFNRKLLGDCFKRLLWNLFKVFAGFLDEFLRIIDSRLFVKLVLGTRWAKQQDNLHVHQKHLPKDVLNNSYTEKPAKIPNGPSVVEFIFGKVAGLQVLPTYQNLSIESTSESTEILYLILKKTNM